MPKKNDLTVEKIREQTRKRGKKHYEAHKEEVNRKNRERYHRKKMDKKLSKMYERDGL